MSRYKLFFGVLFIIVIILVINVRESQKYSRKLINGCLCAYGVSGEELLQPVSKMLLCYSNLYLCFNSKYTAHWSLVIQTDDGKYYSISTSRYGAVFLIQCTFDGKSFYEDRWNCKFVPDKNYTPKTPITLYDVIRESMEYRRKYNDGNYSLLNHNCHHASIAVIKSLCNYASNDELLEKYAGGRLIKEGIRDSLTGPFIFH